ncbi:MAG TPA: hypothetical protein VKE96_13990 [Vicinamibacterales bacterium]|nr:hypothetical protein [Vicinamibacterales bacterium]
MSTYRDVRYALRILGRNKAFAAAALIVVALGVGATTAVFTLSLVRSCCDRFPTATSIGSSFSASRDRRSCARPR